MSKQAVTNENLFGNGKIFVEEEKDEEKALRVIKLMFCWCADGGGGHVFTKR